MSPSPRGGDGPLGDAPRVRPRQRLFAWLMAQMAARYDRDLASRKRALLGSLTGTVLEIGPGTGSSLAFLPSGIRWIGLEPNVAMHGYLEREARRQGLSVELRRGFAERSGLPDSSVDAVISSLVLCSVRELEPTLAELLRILVPGGRLVFLEHVGAESGTWLRRVQGWARPAWRFLFDNCHPDRDTAQAIAAAGFVGLRYERFAGPLPIPVIRPHVVGLALKPGGPSR